MQIQPLSLDTSSFTRSIQNDEGASLPIPGVSPDTQNGVDAAEGSGQSFGQFLQNAISEVNDSQNKAGDMMTRFAAGENMDVHQVMIASQEASVSLSLALNLRNKLMDSYQELMKISM